LILVLKKQTLLTSLVSRSSKLVGQCTSGYDEQTKQGKRQTTLLWESKYLPRPRTSSD